MIGFEWDEKKAKSNLKNHKVSFEEGATIFKVISYHQRRGKPKSGTDWQDLTMLLTFPELKRDSGSVPVVERLQLLAPIKRCSSSGRD